MRRTCADCPAHSAVAAGHCCWGPFLGCEPHAVPLVAVPTLFLVLRLLGAATCLNHRQPRASTEHCAAVFVVASLLRCRFRGKVLRDIFQCIVHCVRYFMQRLARGEARFWAALRGRALPSCALSICVGVRGMPCRRLPDDGTLFFTKSGRVACFGLLLEKQGFWAMAYVWVYMTRLVH